MVSGDKKDMMICLHNRLREAGLGPDIHFAACSTDHERFLESVVDELIDCISDELREAAE